MFQGLSTALTSLYATRQALETTGNNIANVDTEGYTRQRVELEARGGNSIPSFHSQTPKVGQGVNLKDISRMADEYANNRVRQEHANQGELDRSKTIITSVENSFGEPGEKGLQSLMSAYWAAWDDLGNNPGDLAARSQVVEQAKTLADSIKTAAGDMDRLKDASLDSLKNDVNSLNSMASSIADLNRSIQSAVNMGNTPNELLDRRDLLVKKMSDLAGVTVRETSAGSIAVEIGGTAIVRDDRTTKLQVDSTASPVVLRWDNDNSDLTVTDGYVAELKGGDIGGLMTGINATIPKYRQLLDGVAANLISTVNTQHANGLDQNGNPGGPFFAGSNAANIQVDPNLAADTSRVAAAKIGGGKLDGENARVMGNLAESTTGPDHVYRNLIDVLGVESQRTQRQVEIQQNITNSVDLQQQSASGVNLDEEMTNLVRYQKAYNAAAKYMSVMDGMFDSLFGMLR